MSDLISRKDVLNLVSKGISTDTYEDMEYTIELFKAIPTAEPKKGIWIEHPMHIECDQCKVWFLKKYLLRNSYCPNCGAKMEKRADGRKKITIERNICPKPECGDEFPIPKEGWEGVSDEHID